MKPARLLLILVAAAFLVLGCEGNADPMTTVQAIPPPPPQPAIAGTWSGTFTMGGAGDPSHNVTATFTQNGTAVTGRIGADDVGWYDLTNGTLVPGSPSWVLKATLSSDADTPEVILGAASETTITLGEYYDMPTPVFHLTR